MKKIRVILIAALCYVPAGLAQARMLGTHGDWLVYNDDENGNLTCVMSTEPKKSAGKYKKRGPIYAVISHRPAEKLFYEFSFQAGYTFKKDSNVSVVIDKTNKFSLFTRGGHAWATDSEGDKNLAKAMRRGNKMVVRGVSSRGTKTTDTFSLKGFTAAIKFINKACKVK
ncbi:MAG: hypothetical protein JKY92_07180 [Magnetovibrio sp.]|nr:hypothetical protein [Magnetovibrio sp.]